MVHPCTRTSFLNLGYCSLNFPPYCFPDSICECSAERQIISVWFSTLRENIIFLFWISFTLNFFFHIKNVNGFGMCVLGVWYLLQHCLIFATRLFSFYFPKYKIFKFSISACTYNIIFSHYTTLVSSATSQYIFLNIGLYHDKEFLFKLSSLIR
jgi:hypothetical protein